MSYSWGSVEKHISFQQKKMWKKQPDTVVLKDSFHRTAVHRQKLCVESTVAGILALQMKPVWINIFYIVSKLQYNIDITPLSAGLLKLHNEVVKQASRWQDAAGLLQAFQRNSEDASKERPYITANMTIDEFIRAKMTSDGRVSEWVSSFLTAVSSKLTSKHKTGAQRPAFVP